MHTYETDNSPLTTTGRTHEHAWVTESAHRTSSGTVLYVRCGDCGLRRVDISTRADEPPTAISIGLSD